MKKFVVVGGQYYSHIYGSSSTLHGAKCIATRHAELWDNWQGWHVPSVYASSDLDNGCPAYGVQPVAFHNGKKWENADI